MLNWPAAAASHEGRRALHDLARAAHRAERVSRTLLALVVWPSIFGVLAMIAGLYGWPGSVVGVEGMAGQLLSLMLALFILVIAQALLDRDAEL